MPAADTQVRAGLEGTKGETGAPMAAPAVSTAREGAAAGPPGGSQYVFGLLQQSPALTTLDLSGCQLSGTMAT